MKVLVVEDDVEKLRAIIGALVNGGAISLESITDSRDANSAKRLIMQTSYDLLVLDIAIPTRVDKAVSTEAGLDLLEEICRGSRYRRPQHIVIVTGYSELDRKVNERFPSERWKVIVYDPFSVSWADQLAAQAAHTKAARDAGQATPAQYRSELSIICAMPDIELESILRLPWDWKVTAEAHDGTIYWRGAYERSGRVCTVHAAACSRIGMTWAAILATKMISSFRPRYLIMGGICGGISGQVTIGEVVVAESTWDYGSGKHEVKAGNPVFSVAPHQIPLDLNLSSKVRLLAREPGVLAAIKSRWPSNKPGQELQVRLGPMASGAAVIADQSRVAEIEGHNRKVMAIDMESYAVFAAGVDACDPKPITVSIKGVSDLANEHKDSNSQAYAAYLAAEVIKLLAEQYL